jgi:hypothetical protein
MPNGDTQMQYPFPYKNAGNDISASPNATFTNFDTVNLNVSNNASIGGILSCVNINSTGIISAQTATFGQTTNNPVITSISNFSLGIAATAQLDVINSASSGSFGIGGVNNTQFANTVFIKSTTGLKLEAATVVISIATSPQIDFSTATGTRFLTFANFPNLTINTILGLDGSKNVVSNNTTGSGSVVLSASPTFQGTAQFNALSSLLAIPTSSGGTGLTTVGSNGQVLGVAGGILTYLTLTGIASITGSTNINVTAGPNPVVSLTGVVPIGNGGTGLGVIGSNGQILQVTGGALAYVNPPFVSSVSQTVPAFLSITGSPVIGSGTLAIGLSGSALPTTSGGTGLTTIGTANQFLTVNGAGSALTYITTTPITSIGLIVPAFLNTTGSPLTADGSITIGFSGSALPVLNGGTGVTTSTGTSSVVLSTSPSLVTPDIGVATGAGLTLNVPGTGNSFALDYFQALLLSNRSVHLRMGLDALIHGFMAWTNSVLPAWRWGFNSGVSAMELNADGILTLPLSSGGYRGNIVGLNPPQTIGQALGINVPIVNGSFTDRSTTVNIGLVTTNLTTLGGVAAGIYSYNFDGQWQSNNASSVVTFIFNLSGVTIKTRVTDTPFAGQNNLISFGGNFQVTTAGNSLNVTAIATVGTFSNCSWSLSVNRTG